MNAPATANEDLIYSVELGQSDADMLARPCRDIAPNVISSDRQFAMAAIDEHSQPNGAWPSKITKCVQRCSHRTPGIEHIIDQHNGAAFHLYR